MGPRVYRTSSLAGGEAGGSAVGLILHQLRPPFWARGSVHQALGRVQPGPMAPRRDGSRCPPGTLSSLLSAPFPHTCPVSHTHLTGGACDSRLWERGHRFCWTAGSPALGCGERKNRLNKNISNMKHKVFFLPVNLRVKILVNL